MKLFIRWCYFWCVISGLLLVIAVAAILRLGGGMLILENCECNETTSSWHERTVNQRLN